MKKYAMRVLALVLVVGMMSAMALPASATEYNNAQSSRASSIFPFTMRVLSTYRELTTMNDSAKRFTKSDVSGSGVTVYGKIIHTLDGGKYTAGLGVLNSDGDVEGVTGAHVSSYSSNVSFSRNKGVSDLVAGTTYFLFVQNDSSQSYSMHGTVSADVY